VLPLLARADGHVNRSGFAGGSNSLEGGAMSKQTSNKFSPEVRARAVRWCWITTMSMRRDGRRSFRSQLRSAARRRLFWSG